MTRYIFRRVFMLIPLVIIVSIAIFLVAHVVPGDPIDAILQPGAPPEMREEMRATYGLDRPLWIQYGIWVWRLLHADMGTAIVQSRSVTGLIAENLPYSLTLGVAALAFSAVMGVIFGMAAATFRDTRLDHVSMTLSMIGATVPTFFLGLIFMLAFAVWLRWFPVSGAGTLRSLVLPVLTVGIGGMALVARVTRVAMVEASQQDFVTLLHAKGMPVWRIQSRYILRIAMIPVITILGLRIGWILGGAVAAEYIFARPGLGTLLIRGLTQRDYPLIQGSLLMLSMAVLLGTFLADILQALVDPRVREAVR
ncbi:peptide/nickel transport system permease protein [Rhizobiales bacterium GAS191]|nr:peptide/nickel transport system permease protein [Rhizobiales bacterium GAS191]